MVSAEALARPKKRAFWITMRAWASAMWVNWKREATSPQAKMLGLLVRRWSSTSTPLLAVAHPGGLQPQPLDVGRPAGGDQDLVRRDLVALAVALEGDDPLGAAALDLDDLDAELEAARRRRSSPAGRSRRRRRPRGAARGRPGRAG